MNRITLTIALAVLVIGASAVGAAAQATGGAAQGTITVTPEEEKAYRPIEAAKTVDESFVAAKAFMAKYPKSAALPQVEIAVYNKIVNMPKDETRLVATKTFKETFPASDLGLDLDRTMAEYYLNKGDFKMLDTVCEQYLAKHPDDVRTHYLLLRVAVDALKKQDGSLVATGKLHGEKAIAIFEAAARPADFATDAEWAAFKTENLALAYQSYGLIGLVSGDSASATTYITKATTVAPTDAFNYFLLANILDGDYEVAAKAYNDKIDKTSADAKAKLEAAGAAKDKVIEMLLKAVAHSQGKQDPASQQILGQAMAMLEQGWKLRHNGKLDGLADAIKAAKGGN